MSSMETLWSAPEPVLERLNLKGRDTEWTDFILCGFYCTVAVAFLLFFGFAAVLRGEIAYATVIFGFAAATCIVYGGIWLSGQLYMARHFVVTLMGTLCLFLFYSGGTDNTGPLYYFVFPVVALFLQGISVGSVSVVALLLISIVVQETGMLGFDTGRYSFVFLSRVYAVYVIIALLSWLFAWFRERAERELLLSEEDLESITHADLLTGLANRQFMERLMHLEFSRFQRYGSSFCLMAMKVDKFDQLRRQYGTEYADLLLTEVAALLMKTIRNQDIPSRWESDQLLIMLPEASLESARQMAERVRREIRKRAFTPGSITISAGISEIGESLADTIAVAENNLRIAGFDNGDSVVSGPQPGPRGGPKLSSYFRQAE